MNLLSEMSEQSLKWIWEKSYPVISHLGHNIPMETLYQMFKERLVKELFPPQSEPKNPMPCFRA